MVDVTHDTAATFDSDMEHSVGRLSPALLAAYPNATDEEARQAQLGLERDLRFIWDMWARLQARTGKSPCLLLISTAAAIPGRLGVRGLGIMRRTLGLTACPLWFACRGGMHFLDLKSATMTTW
jgi:hypothetical protein